MPKRKLAPEQVDAAVALYEAGATCQEIADKYGVYAKTMHSRLVGRGVKMRPRGGSRSRALTPEQIREAAKRYEAGASASDIAAHCGCSTTTILVQLRKYGVRTRSSAGTRQAPPEVKALARELREGGATLASVAAQVGYSVTAVSRWTT